MATRTSCWDPKCRGIPFAVNDAASRLSEGYFGRIVYQCDTCEARWSITPEDMLKQLDGKTARRGSRQPKAKSFAELWRDTTAMHGTSRRR